MSSAWSVTATAGVWGVAGAGVGWSGVPPSPTLTLSPPAREKNHSSVPYHYFEKGRLDECKMYLVHERAHRAGHRFITEKAIFSRWAKRKNIDRKSVV